MKGKEGRISLSIHLFSCPNRQPRTVKHEKQALTNRNWIWLTKALKATITSFFQRNEPLLGILTCHS
jgi:hypothetical protein